MPMKQQRRTDRAAFEALINEHLSYLEEFVRHLLDFAASRGDLAPGQLRPADVMDETLLRAYGRFARQPPPAEVRRWLREVASEYLQEEIRRTGWERDRTVAIEEDIPETPAIEEVSTLGDEILDFYQPDEDLKLEDVIPDLGVPTPEQEAEREDLRRCVKTALEEMPGDWRRALLLRYVHDLTGARLAKSMGKSRREVDLLLDYAAGYLRKRLAEAGLIPGGPAGG